MALSTDSVSIFAEGTFEEQILELVGFLVRGRSQEDRNAFSAPFHNALKQGEGRKPIEEDEGRKKLILSKILADVHGLGDGTDKEIEGFFNLLFAHIFALYPENAPEISQYVDYLLKTLSVASSEKLPLRYRVLSNLFNSLPRTSPLRHSVYQTLLKIATTNDDLDALELSKSDVEKWLSEWDISNEAKSAFLKSIVDAYIKADQPAVSYAFSLLYVQALPPSSPQSQAAAIEVIATALRLPTIFDFDPLFKLDAVLAIKNHELFHLLYIFLNSGLPDFKTWEANHPGALEKYQIPSSELGRKIRLLTLASLASRYVGQNLPHANVAEALQVDPSQVENWVIDVIRAGLVWGKLSQTSQSLHVTRATPRSFEKEQWQALERRLLAWKQGLAGVLDVVANAKRLGGQTAT